MKKLLFLVTTFIILCLSVPVFAASSTISIKNNEVNSKPVSYMYDADSSGETVKSIKSLMTKLDELPKQSSVVQTITISSLSANSKPVNFRLRLSLPEKSTGTEKPEKIATPSPDEYSALDYYNIKITTVNGDVVYDSGEAEEETEQKTYKDIALGTLNRTEAAENRIYNLTVSVNKDLKNNAGVQTALRKLDWSIVSDSYNTGDSTIPGDGNSAAEQLEQEEISAGEQPEKAGAAENTPSPSAAAETRDGADTAQNNINTSLKKGEYVIGTDIPAGRYKMTGQGKVSVYTSDGILKMSILLKHKGDTDSNGIDEYVMSVNDGEMLKVDNEITLMPHKAQSMLPSPTPAASPSNAGNKNSTSASSKAGANTSSGAGSASKTNPKTGDTTPVALIAIAGVLSIAGVFVIEIKKRRIDK